VNFHIKISNSFQMRLWGKIILMTLALEIMPFTQGALFPVFLSAKFDS
jgi:hypothetical protein